MCQPNELEREIKKKTGGASRGPSKNLGRHGPLRPPLSIDTVVEYSKPTQTLGKCESQSLREHSSRIGLDKKNSPKTQL